MKQEVNNGKMILIIGLTIFLTIFIDRAVAYILSDNGNHTVDDTLTVMNFDIPEKSNKVENLGYIMVAGEKTDLSWKQLQVGDVLTDVTLDKKADYFDQVDTSTLADFSGYKVIETVPSLDTPVCTMQTKQLEFAAKKYPEVNFLIVSNDTPFALQRFCAANKIQNLHVMSDARSREFGKNNALFMEKYGLLARTIMIVDENNKILYIEYANEVTKELDLLNAFAKLNELLKEKK